MANAERRHLRIRGEQPIPIDAPSLAVLSILVVDDNSDACEVVRRILAGTGGATVVTACSAAEALAAIEKSPPHVVVCDIGMPHEDGYEFIRKVRALPPKHAGTTPAVALTAFARSKDRQRALLAGYQIHVAKPVDPSELITVSPAWRGRTLDKPVSVGQLSSLAFVNNVGVPPLWRRGHGVCGTPQDVELLIRLNSASGPGSMGAAR